jgi:hypothetical protein
MARSSSTLPAQAPGQPREITLVTRRDIFGYLRAKQGLGGGLGEIGFLRQLYDLNALPPTDPRHVTAVEDITRHRAALIDWDDDWVLDDPSQRQHWHTEGSHTP